MPIVSFFYGIIIRMYFFDDRQHHIPHFHAESGGERAVFSIPEGETLAGSLPGNKARLVQAWIEIHKEELILNWQLAIAGDELFRIEPLR